MAESDPIKMYYVYIYFDPTKPTFSKNELIFDYEPIYVGCGSRNRWKDHLSQAKNREFLKNGNKYKFYKLKQILSLGFEPIIIKYKENLTKEEAFAVEKMLIDKIGLSCRDNGPLTNLVDGGRVNPTFSGEQNPMYGCFWSDERKKAHSDKIKAHNKKLSKEEYDKKYRNREISDETRRKLSDASRGANNPMYGRKKVKPEKIPKVSSRVKFWRVILPNGDTVETLSLHAFCKNLNICADSLKKAGKSNRTVESGPAKGYSAIAIPVNILN